MRAPQGAVLLGADYRALGVVRSLGRRGVPVWVLAERSEPLAAVSRYARASMRWPTLDTAQRTRFLCDLAIDSGLEGWALIPSTDSAAAMLAREHDRLAEHYTHTTPPWEVMRWAYDKRLTHELAERAGVPSPRTIWPAGTLQNDSLGVPFPAALKPAIKDAPNALTVAKAWRVENPADLRQRCAEASRMVDPELLMVQELIPGGGDAQYSYAALCRDGTPLAAVTARRTRQYPAEFGRASTFVETLECPEAVELSLRLLAELRYTGLIEIEYKRDPRDGVLKLLDMNPRVWGWHTLCARAGVDFAWLLWLLVSGQEVPPSRARSGARWLRFTTDVPAALTQLLRRRLSVREYARSLRPPRESAIFAWDDPVPGLIELPMLVCTVARRLLYGEPV